jgi:hypothetical protein
MIPTNSFIRERADPLYQPLEGLVVVAAEVVTVEVVSENGVATVQAYHTFPIP